MTDPKKQLREFVVETFLFGEAGGLTDDTSFLREGIIDSTGVLELVAYLEASHGVKIKDEELIPENLDSISAIAAYLAKKKG
jgi:acyl carrier protein